MAIETTDDIKLVNKKQMVASFNDFWLISVVIIIGKKSMISSDKNVDEIKKGMNNSIFL